MCDPSGHIGFVGGMGAGLPSSRRTRDGSPSFSVIATRVGYTTEPDGLRAEVCLATTSLMYSKTSKGGPYVVSPAASVASASAPRG